MHFTSRTIATSLSALLLGAAALHAQQTTPALPDDTATPAAAATAANPAPAHANSKVRIVRLSEVKGDVQLDRNTGQGFEAAMANIPIIENARLQTNVGAAEIEFEDNSTLRIAPDSLIEFPQLELLPSGAKASTVNVLRGMVYVSLVNTKENQYTLAFAQEKIHLQPSSHIRFELESSHAKLTVFEGAVSVERPAGTFQADKKKTFIIDLANPDQPILAKNITPDPFDTWDHTNAAYHKQYANQTAFGNMPYSYGVSDMLYYGNFVNAGGCGSMWQPYFVSAGWDPFANGAWAYYSGAGYSWVSPYPWGWTPYHYGNWISCPGVGWGWQPGGTWNGLGNQPVALNGQGGIIPRPPTHAPLSGWPTLVSVNNKPLATSGARAGSDAFYFRNNSAGMGVPRGTLGKLSGYSNDVAHHGSAWTPVYQPGSEIGGGGRAAGLAPVQPGSAPDRFPSAMSPADSDGVGRGSGSMGSRSPYSSVPARAPAAVAPATVPATGAPGAPR